MKKDAITFTQLAARLEKALHCDVGLEGLEILIYGWMKKRGRPSGSTLSMREKQDGVKWLAADEAYSFSRYTGYDLTRD